MEQETETQTGLERILQRIPPTWGAAISCGPGWNDLLTALDGRLATIDPSYQVQQVKEKFGGLRYYWSPSATPMECCTAWEEEHPSPERGATEGEWERWTAARDAHQDDEAHRAHAARWEEVTVEGQRLVAEAEEEALRTCEETGRPGVLMVRRGWYRTLDPTSAPEGFEVAQGGAGAEWELRAAGNDPERLARLARTLITERTHLLEVLEATRRSRT